MEVSINHGVFKLFGVMPVLGTAGSGWKRLFNVAYSLALVAFIVGLQLFIYYIHLERDFSGWFISTSALLTCVVILVQALASGQRLASMMHLLRESESSLQAYSTGRWRFGAVFYISYAIGIARCVFRTAVLVYLGLRNIRIAILLATPSLIILIRVNQQIYLIDLITCHLEGILAELTASLEDDGRLTVEDVGARLRCGSMLQCAENQFGRLQKCLTMINSVFGWSTAAIVVFVFVSITFQFRTLMYALPIAVQITDVLYSILLLLLLCRSSSFATDRVKDIRRTLLKPYYHASLWDQVHNFLVRTKLQPFEFTANGLYTINYALFGSTLAASATYIVIMLQFEQKTPGS